MKNKSKMTVRDFHIDDAGTEPGVVIHKKLKAVWGIDYDYRSKRRFRRPCCPECEEAIHLCGDGIYRCYFCGESVEINSMQRRWFKKREGEKEKVLTCIMCGGETMHAIYYRNNATRKWQPAHGKCSECGARFIV